MLAIFLIFSFNIKILFLSIFIFIFNLLFNLNSQPGKYLMPIKIFLYFFYLTNHDYFFAGDFFCAENDKFSFDNFSKSIGNENKCILNFEGTFNISNNIKMKRKINLIQNKNILNKLPKIFT